MSAPLLQVELGDDGHFVGGRILSYRQVRPRGPLPDRTGEAARLIEALSLEDFPDSAPGFAEDGRLLP